MFLVAVYQDESLGLYLEKVAAWCLLYVLSPVRGQQRFPSRLSSEDVATWEEGLWQRWCAVGTDHLDQFKYCRTSCRRRPTVVRWPIAVFHSRTPGKKMEVPEGESLRRAGNYSVWYLYWHETFLDMPRRLVPQLCGQICYMAPLVSVNGREIAFKMIHFCT